MNHQTLILPTLEKIGHLEEQLLCLPQVDLPVTHRFGPGVYIREMFCPKNTFIIGHAHTTEHFNMVMMGRASVLSDGKLFEMKAPMTFVSGAGVRKMAYIHEDMLFATIHPMAGLEHCGEDIEKLESALCVKSQAYIRHEEMKKLLEAA